MRNDKSTTTIHSAGMTMGGPESPTVTLEKHSAPTFRVKKSTKFYPKNMYN